MKYVYIAYSLEGVYYIFTQFLPAAIASENLFLDHRKLSFWFQRQQLFDNSKARLKMALKSDA